MKPVKLLVSIMLFCFYSSAYSQVKLNSYPSATATIYLDFDGEYVVSPIWNNGKPLNCDPSGMNDTQITEVFNRVSEDYRPFNINVTTDEDVFLNAPEDRRMRVVITPTSSWFAGVGGIAYVSSFTWGDDTPCFVFCDRLGPRKPKMVAECCSHESGHTLGLSHQSKYDATCALTATYNDGAGSGEIAWAPIMGNSYYRNMSGWNNGPTPYGCSNTQDNLSIITTQNGFTYRTDDFADDFNTTTEFNSPLLINVSGLISTNTDKDAFKINLSQNAVLRLQADPFSIADNNEGADLDIKLSLYRADKSLIATYNPSNTMSVTIDTVLTTGTYYVIVEGTGNNNAADYGSLGSYTLRGLPGVLPICNATLTGKTEKNQHSLSWTIQCDQAIRTVTLQQSTDAISFTDYAAINGGEKNILINAGKTDVYYRLRLITYGGHTDYSNTVLIRKGAENAGQFKIPALVHDKLIMYAPNSFQFRLLDMSGNIILKGNAAEGYSNFDISNKANGTYIIQVFSKGLPFVQRIVKQ